MKTDNKIKDNALSEHALINHLQKGKGTEPCVSSIIPTEIMNESVHPQDTPFLGNRHKLPSCLKDNLATIVL